MGALSSSLHGGTLACAQGQICVYIYMCTYWVSSCHGDELSRRFFSWPSCVAVPITPLLACRGFACHLASPSLSHSPCFIFLFVGLRIVRTHKPTEASRRTRTKRSCADPQHRNHPEATGRSVQKSGCAPASEGRPPRQSHLHPLKCMRAHSEVHILTGEGRDRQTHTQRTQTRPLSET